MTGTQSEPTALTLPRVAHRQVEVNGLKIFYRGEIVPLIGSFLERTWSV
jgi:hypothetical protein